MTDIVNEENNTVQLPEEEQNTVVTDNGTTYESQESGIIAKEEADRAKQWAEESERQANIATTASTNAASSENLARVYKESAEASENYVRGITTSTAFTNVSNDLSSPNSSIRTVSTNIAKVQEVANIADDIDTVMDISEDITAVAGNSSNINTVATNSSDINTVASNISDINTVVVNITDIQNAYDNAQLAKDWAIKTNGTVDGSDYSAKYYAQQASTSATSASTSATSADISATSASNSATSASTSATNASTSATSASNSATSATTSATSASTSASNAASSATLAQNWAIKTNGTVDGSDYSAKYYAQQAQQAASDVSNKANKDLSNLSSTGEARFTAKQNTLVSGTNIKTINGQSVLGSGNLNVTTSTVWGGINGSLSNQTDLQNALNAKANNADLATVATSGSYNDLSNKPTIPAAQVNSDWNATSGAAQILNKPDLSNYVTLDTNQTISGSKTFTQFTHYKTDIAYTDTPSSSKYGGFNFLDKNGSEISAFYTGLYTSGEGLAGFNLKNKSGNTAELYINYNANGDFYTRAPTPTDTTTTSGTQIATTGWVNSTGNNVVHLSGTETISGNKTFTGNKVFVGGYANVVIKSTTNNNSDYSDIEFDKANGTRIGNIRVHNNGDCEMAMFTSIMLSAIYPYADNSYKLGDSSQRWKQLYAGTATINTSDERVKQQIEFIPDEVLDAWGEVNFYQYKFNDAVEEKGEKARLHTGMIAQRIENTFKAHNLDAFKYGLLCYDEWEARKEEIDKNGEISRPGREAGNRYSLRYEECLCMEAAYQRRRADRIEKRLNYIDNLLKQNYNNEELTL